jgi:hypothetical protein
MKEGSLMEKYFDKNGEEIKQGMTLVHDDGEREYVYPTKDDLGFNASNENWIGFDELKREIYPLYQFNLKEWSIEK